jgi:hypothetical protein
VVFYCYKHVLFYNKTCHLDTSLQLRSILIQVVIVEVNFMKENKADYGSV